jgi:NaMN:DMB phosphoribosyltransferase
MKTSLDVIIAHNKPKAEAFLTEIEGKKPLFNATIATTETGKIPGLSAAGQNPDFTDFTPPADAELLLLGKCKSIQGVPITPDGIPTPGLITMSALRLADIPVVVANGGVKVKPQIPFIELGGNSGRDIRTSTQLITLKRLSSEPKPLVNNSQKLLII